MKSIEVVAAVIRDGNRILATQRGYGEFKDWWEFPGGKTESSETLEEALKREIMEELDTEIIVGNKIGTVEWDYPTFHITLHCFWAEAMSLPVLKEHEASRWLSREELSNVNWLPADISLIEKIKQSL